MPETCERCGSHAIDVEEDGRFIECRCCGLKGYGDWNPVYADAPHTDERF